MYMYNYFTRKLLLYNILSYIITMTDKNEKIYYEDFYLFITNHNERFDDYKNQYINLLSELSICENISNEIFFENLNQINSIGTIIIAYHYNTDNTITLVGTGTIIIEPKVIRNGKSVGHIEDIVVKSTYRGKKISQSILEKLKNFAREKNCYKVILDCNENVCPVYKSNGFEIKGIQMSLYF